MSWKNIRLIFMREYLTRVTSKTFILGTILTPLGIALLMFVSVKIMTSGGDNVYHIAVVDESGIFKSRLHDTKKFDFEDAHSSLQSVLEEVKSKKYDAALRIPAPDSALTNRLRVFLYSDKRFGLETSEALSTVLEKQFRNYKMNVLNVDDRLLAHLKTTVTIDPEPLDSSAKDRSAWTEGIAAGIGSAMGFAMYMVVLIYGMMVMRSVMEEKTNRIAEVIISSVRPVELMTGKILGVGAVGLTQLAFWMIVIPLMSLLMGPLIGTGMSSPLDAQTMTELEGAKGQIGTVLKELMAINWALVIPLFIFYFLGGYFIYAALFAAVGSAVGDDVGESQSLVLPVTIPVIISIYIMMAVIRDPNTDLAVWSSIFPLFSPIVMPARLPYNPPAWQIIASVVSLVLGVLFFAWLAGRIYRVGILMYGKKASFKELGKWIFRKE